MASSSMDVLLVVELGVIGAEKLCSDLLKGVGRARGDAPRGWSGATRPEFTDCVASLS
jgi:hypothetical protein